MDGGADGNHFVRVDAFVWLFAAEFTSGLDDFRHTSHAADENQFVDFRKINAGFFDAITDGLLGALEQAIGELFQLGTCECELDVFRTSGVCGNERQVDVEGLAR